MEKDLINFIIENKLFTFNSNKTILKENRTIFKTKDSKSVYNKTLNNISSNFCFKESSNLFNYFSFTDNKNEIIKRQDFFKRIPVGIENSFLDLLKKPRAIWKPKYGIIVVTEDEETFKELKNLNIPIKILINEEELSDLKTYDLVQVINCDQFKISLEQLPQSVFIDSPEDIYLERYLEELSGWKDNMDILEKNDDPSQVYKEIKTIIEELKPVLNLIEKESLKKISRNELEEILESINEEVSDKIKTLNISGEILFKMLSDNKLPEELDKIIDNAIKTKNIPNHLVVPGIPVKINENELEEFLRSQDLNEYSDFSIKIKRNKELLKKVPKKLERLAALLLLYDFVAGISKFLLYKENWPEIDETLYIERSKNIFLDKPQEISFYLDSENRGSILTGANSGGKTTLIEHIIQIITLANLGLPSDGKIKLPMFSEVYYFAKNKGSASKGAFETLLVQMSGIKPGKQTLILADEIESVTEPGVAGKIIAATSKYFIEKNCFLIIATHLGHEIKKVLPKGARIDGIEAKGLNDKNELVIDHNPVIGRLANSTPELIVEKMANSNLHEYFNYIHDYLKNA